MDELHKTKVHELIEREQLSEIYNDIWYVLTLNSEDNIYEPIPVSDITYRILEVIVSDFAINQNSRYSLVWPKRITDLDIKNLKYVYDVINFLKES